VSDEKTKKFILKKRWEGIVCFMTFDGLYNAKVDDFIKQPADGILYDLNRDIATTLTIMPEKRWINDLAVAVTITALKKRIDELEGDEDVVYTGSENKSKGAIEMSILAEQIEVGSERPTEVVKQMSELDNAITKLGSTLDGLEPKLEKVVKTSTTTDEDKMEPQEALCSLASDIRSFRYRIESMSARVRDTLSRLEL